MPTRTNPKTRSGESKSAFNFRVADEAALAQLAGFQHNAVTPFGTLDPKVPVVLACAVRPRAFRRDASPIRL
jgi:prolyl-tRNA editing enzyme YbaK/EbsC (Cys-tRNA(Pro) deacylase)